MTGFVKIKNGTYRNTAIANEVFPLVKHYTVGAKGGFITVDGTGQFGKDKIRVLVESPTDIEFVHADEYTGVVTAKEVTATNTQTDEERIADIALRRNFEVFASDFSLVAKLIGKCRTWND